MFLGIKTKFLIKNINSLTLTIVSNETYFDSQMSQTIRANVFQIVYLILYFDF